MTKIYRITLPYKTTNYLMLNWAKVHKICSLVINGQNNGPHIPPKNYLLSKNKQTNKKKKKKKKTFMIVFW